MSPLDRAIRLLSEEITPEAQRMDQDRSALSWALGRLAEEGLLALKRPAEYGGPNMDEEDFRRFQEEVARVSGSLAFLQTQHQSAVGLIARGENEDLKREYLPFMHDGTKLVGIGFSQLRRPGPPIMKATPDKDGYRLDGTVPWVTGAGFYPEFLVGASLPDGRAVFGIVPLTDQEGVRLSPPMKLAAMEAANTVAVEFEGFSLGSNRVSFHKPVGWIQRNDMINIALQGHFAIGCALAGLDVLKTNAEKKGMASVQQAHSILSDELEECREATRQAQASVSEETTDERLAVRAWAIELAVRCAHAAVTSSSGAANSLDHPAQRIYREALVYTVSAQTGPIMEATIRRLISRSR